MFEEAPLERVVDDAPQDTVGSILSNLSDQFEQDRGNEQVTTAETPATLEQTTAAPTPEATPPEDKPAEEGVKAEGAEAAPATKTEAEPEPSVPTPESRLAPIFELSSLPPAEALPQAIQVMNNLYQHDQIAYSLLANAIIQASPTVSRDIVLEREGIPLEKVGEFKEWIKNGANALPEIASYPAFEKLVQPLESAEGEQWVRLPNGQEVNLADARDKSYFELEKRLYEGDVEKKVGEREAAKATAEREAEAKREQEAVAERDFLSRVDYFSGGRYDLVKATLEPLLSALSPEDKLRGDMFKAYARDYIDNHKEIERLSQQAAPYVQAGHGFEKDASGQWKMGGRAGEIAAAQDRIIKRELNNLIDAFNKDILRTNRAELAATTTAPKIPSTVKQIEVVNTQSTGLESATTFEDILAHAREIDRRSAGAGN